MSLKNQEKEQKDNYITKTEKMEKHLNDSECDSDDSDGNKNSIFSQNLYYRPTEEERMKLANMFIEVIHTVPPQHQIENTAGTRTLYQREKDEFEKFITLKCGKFSIEEDNIIEGNWKKFCKMYNWNPSNPKPFLQMKLKNKVFFLNLRNRLKFVQFLANGLFDRSLYSVYHRFKLKYNQHKMLRYKPEEDIQIMKYMETCNTRNNNRKFADLAILLKRTRHSVWRRYRILKKNYKLDSENQKLCWLY